MIPVDGMDSTELLAHKLTTLHTDVVEIKTALRQLSEAITKLALVEERQMETQRSMDRAFAMIDRMDRRLSALEIAWPMANRSTLWVERALIALASAAVVYVGRKVGLF